MHPDRRREGRRIRKARRDWKKVTRAFADYQRAMETLGDAAQDAAKTLTEFAAAWGFWVTPGHTSSQGRGA